MADRILIIEDDVDLQKILYEKLSLSGYDVILAGSGKKGLFMATKYTPDLILLDIMLPENMNGFDVLEKFKKNDELKNTPVIVMTNLDTERETAMQIGANDYFIKPNINLDLLIEKIEGLLNQS